MKGFAGFDVGDEVLGHEFVRFPRGGREARSVSWTNKVGIGLQGSAFRTLDVNALTGIDLIFKGVQDFDGSTVYVVVDSARTDRSWYGGHARVNPAPEQKFGESLCPGFRRGPCSARHRFHHFRDFKRPVGKEVRHGSSVIEDPLFCLMENNAEGVAPAGLDRADPVSHRSPDESACSLDRPFMNGENEKVPQIGIERDRSGLLPRPVFDEYEFTALKLLSFPTQHDHGLQGKEGRTIDVPVQTIEISTVIPKQQGGGLGLPLAVTFLLKGCQGCGVLLGAVQPVHHAVGNGCQMRIQVGPYMRNQRGQWIGKIGVLPLSEAIACHVDPGSKMPVVIIECSQGPAGGGWHDMRHMGIPAREDRVFDGNPIQRVKIRKV